VRGGTTGAVEVYHALCLLLGGEPLGAPLTLIVGGLVTNFEAHGSFADEISIRGRRVPEAPDVDGSEFVHHGVDLQSIDGRVIPAATVRGLLAAAVTEHHHQVLIGATTACQAACLIVQTLIVADPQGDIPGLPVCPTVEGGVGCGAHVGSFGMG